MNSTRYLLPTEPWKNDLLRVLLIAYPFSFALDFKGPGGGSLEQIVMAVSSVAVFLAILITGSLRATRGIKLIICSSFFFSVLGCLTAVYYSVPADQMVRLVFPYWLFTTGVWAGTVAANSLELAWGLFRAMVSAGVISLFFRYYYATEVSGLEMDEMRYQVLSPAICSLIAYVCATFCFMRKLNLTAMFIGGVTIVVISLSVTRSFLITFCFTVVGVSLLIMRLNWDNPGHKIYLRWRKIGLIFVCCGSVIGLAAAYEIRPAVFDAWASRLYSDRVNTSSGDDVNLISRVAEAKGIWEEVSETPLKMFFGKGFGNTYHWSDSYMADVRSVSEEIVTTFFVPTWNAAHSPFTYALLFGGIPAMIWQVWIFAAPLWHGWQRLRWLRTIADSRFLQIFTFNLLSLFLFLSQSLTSNPFGERLSAQYLGLSIGLLLAAEKTSRSLVSER